MTQERRWEMEGQRWRAPAAVEQRCADRRRNQSPSCARRGPARTCAPSSGPSCWRNLEGRLPCSPPEGSWGSRTALWPARRGAGDRACVRPRRRLLGTLRGCCARRGRRKCGRGRRPFELRPVVVWCRTRPRLGTRRGLARRGRRKGRRGLASQRCLKPSQPQEPPLTGLPCRKQQRRRLFFCTIHSKS